MSDLDWLAGLADGEGCFSLSLGLREGGRRRVTFEFGLALRADDLPTLLEVQRILGVGRISTSGREGRNAGGGYYGRPMRKFYVNREADLPRVVEAFRASPLRSKKRRDFDLWSAALSY